MDKATLKNLYFTCVYPYLIYCVEVWGNACDTHLEPIIKMQKRCIRTITFSCYFEQTEPLFKELEILSFKKLVIQRILLMMFKYSLGIVPKPITLLFTRNDEIHHHNTRYSNLLHPMVTVLFDVMICDYLCYIYKLYCHYINYQGYVYMYK